MLTKWLLIGLSLSTGVAAAESYHFASINLLAEQEVGRIVLPELYKKLNINISISPFPGKRAEYTAVSGQLDGEIMRIYSYGEENPAMIRVPTAYYYLETMPFVLKSRNLRILDRDDLRPLSIAKVRGVKHTNNITAGMTNVHNFDSPAEIMRMVAQGFVDVALTNTLGGLLVIEGFQIETVVPSGKALDRLDLFHYIHQDHKDLVPRIDAVIAQSLASGELEKMIAAAEKQVIEQGTTIYSR
ncbi:ABC transporter substrate-binding protein [Lacimicrobium alkaliphilum]|uniref:ABC transporter substrate-binding protein n=2 Tax=Lacimicrobium alkaliphilum TaxID=1526571 RepID=A0ABQ1RH86_9ALTE|nr:ABC transporter substrate-binding protein [Lacimicrobium alkaliphilum]